METNGEISRSQLLKLLETQNYHNVPIDDAIAHLGIIIDGSSDLNYADGLTRSFELGEELLSRNVTSKQSAVVHYFLSNSSHALSRLNSPNFKKGGSEWDGKILKKK